MNQEFLTCGSEYIAEKIKEGIVFECNEKIDLNKYGVRTKQ